MSGGFRNYNIPAKKTQTANDDGWSTDGSSPQQSPTSPVKGGVPVFGQNAPQLKVKSSVSQMTAAFEKKASPVEQEKAVAKKPSVTQMAAAFDNPQQIKDGKINVSPQKIALPGFKKEPSPVKTTFAQSEPSNPFKKSPIEQFKKYPSEFDSKSIVLSRKFPQFNASEIDAFYQQFNLADTDGHDSVHLNDLSSIATKAGVSYQRVVEKLGQLNLTSKDGHVTFEGFMTAVADLTKNQKSSSDKTIRLHGHSENITHTINEDEKESFVQHINSSLHKDKDIGSRFPIDAGTMQVFSECRDGLLLAKLINDSVPGTIDERVLNMSKKLSPFQMTENLNVVVNSAKAIGCSVVNIGAQDVMEGREHLILGLLWQIIRAGLAAKVDIRFHPELFRLLEQGETLEEFLKLPTEKILLRWFNYHLKKANWSRRVSNLSSDVKDGENYTVLLNQLAPTLCSRVALREPDLYQRAEIILQNADKLGCRKYLTPKSLVGGNPKLNFAFVANLFNLVPGLDPLSESEKAQLDDWLFGSEGDREARAFSLWLNSFGVEPFVNNLYDDVSDGLVLLQAIDHIHPGQVDWKKVNRAPVASKFKKVENTNYVVAIGQLLKFTLVGIQGSDLTDGVKILILGYVWQLMRDHVIQTLKTLSQDGVDITDADLLKWANETVKRGGRFSSISSFKDPSLRSGVFLLDVLNGMKKGIVDYGMVTDGKSDQDCNNNARYAISIARKLGAAIFILPEDVLECKPKMILTFIGTLMALDKAGIEQ